MASKARLAVSGARRCAGTGYGATCGPGPHMAPGAAAAAGIVAQKTVESAPCAGEIATIFEKKYVSAVSRDVAVLCWMSLATKPGWQLKRAVMDVC